MGTEKVVQLPTLRRAPARPQPPQVVPFTDWVAARDRVASALLGGARRVLVTGSAGTGKTVLLDHAARVLRAAGRSVTVQLADADPAPPEAGMTLFVDEADRLAPAKLRALQEAPGAVLLAGLGGTLSRRPAAGTVHLVLQPLEREAARDYIAEWLALTGRRVTDLDSSGVRRLVELSGGVPRLLSTLLAASAWVAETGGAAVISAEHVQEAAELRSILTNVEPIGEPTARRGGRVVWSVLLVGVVAVAAGVAAAPRLFPAETTRLVALATDGAHDAEHWVRRTLHLSPPGRDLPIRPAPAVVMAPPPAVVTPPAPVVPPVPEAPAATPPEHVAASVAPAAEPPAIVAPPPAAPMARVASTPRVAPTEALPIETIEFLLRRGREMLALDDVSAARLLFRRAAEAGSAEAMVQLGQTFDPAYLNPIGAARLADRAEMLRWYQRAAAAGDKDAATRLEK